MITATWKIQRLRYVCKINPIYGKRDYLSSETEVSFLPMDSIGENGALVLDKTKKINEVSTGYTYFESQDVIFAKITPCFENGKGAVAEGLFNEVAFGTTELHVLRPNYGIITSKYLYYLTTSELFRKTGESYMYGAGGQKRVPEDFVKDFVLKLPPLPVQKSIASYLDKETARIDALIAKKERQIELLQEKRQAIITQAVTKGLDPNAKMKDSGVEWIGKIPEEWIESKGRFLFSFIGGGTPSSEEATFWEGDIPWVSSKDMKRLFLEDTEDHISSIAVRNSSTNIIPSNTLLIVMRSGILQHTIPVAIIGKDMAINQDIKGFLPKQALNPIYFAYFIQGFQAQLLTEWRKEGATVESLDLDSIKNFSFPIPSLIDQNNIVKTIAIQIEVITNLVNKVLESISLLREYRSSLITAAVSGQIDVSQEAIK